MQCTINKVNVHINQSIATTSKRKICTLNQRILNYPQQIKQR